jgi:hypothetical protein
LIVSDGGSTDGTLKLLEKGAARDPRLRWSSTPDTGPAAAVNRAAGQARGDILGWLNADDVYAPDAVGSAVSHFAAHPDCDLVYGHAEFIDAEGRTLGPYPTKDPRTPVAAFADGCFVCQPTAFLRREAWDRWGGLDEPLQTSFDFDLWIRAFQEDSSRIGFLDRVQALSRRHNATITSRQRKEVALEGLTILRRHLDVTPPHWVLTYLEEIMAQHPDGSPQSLRDQADDILQAAQEIMHPQDFAALTQIIHHDRRFTLAGNAISIDVFPDGWAGPELTVRCDASRCRGVKLTCRSGMPARRKHRLETHGPNGSLHRLSAMGEHLFELELPALGASVCTYTIVSRETFCPAQSKRNSNDHRRLAFQVLESTEIL